MSYSILIISSAYENYVTEFLTDIPCEVLTFKEIKSQFIKNRYGFSNFQSKYWSELGCKSEEIYVNIELFQKKWAAENNVSYNNETWLEEIMLAQIKLFNPDVIYTDNLYLINSSIRSEIRNLIPGIVITGWRYAPTKDYKILSDLDIVFTGSKEWQTLFAKNGLNSFYVPLGFEPSLLNEIEIKEGKKNDFTFTGSIGERNGYHSNRYKMIETLMEKTPLEIWSDITPSLFYNKKLNSIESVALLASNISKLTGIPQRFYEKLPLFRKGLYISKNAQPTLQDKYHDRTHKPVFGLKYHTILASSKITFNYHIDIAGKEGGNVRLFEGTGLGACLLTDWKQNMQDYFISDYEIVTYKNIEEAIEKVNYLLDHEEVRKQIALSGQKKTLSKYTLKHRIIAMDYHIIDLLKEKHKEH